MNMDTHMSGSTVKNLISFKIVLEYNAIRKIRTGRGSWFIYNSFKLVNLNIMTPSGKELIIQITIQQSSQVKVWINKHRETRSLLKHQKSCYMNQPKSQYQKKRGSRAGTRGNRIPTYQNGCKNSERILWMKEFLNTETHTRVLLMNHL